ncbi:hypothetical protein M3B92_15670 [Brevibacterium casei]|uniref:VC0807 family protein n=1 Tax=Brevibacterium casei TaxID=33889 RepID=UPI00223BE443|nr:VC0807 family protein [Brevibacterium casei]MCT1767553.1 hypothetical protein [Brevibacterium casei]
MEQTRESWLGVARTVLLEVALPLGVYGALRVFGVSEVWSLVAASGASALNGAAQWLRRRSIGLLGVIILLGLLVSAAIALVTDDPVAVYLVDPASNVLVAVLVVSMVSTQRPFVARIRRELSPRPTAFDCQWTTNSRFRAAHRQASWIWFAGLLLLAAVWVGFIAALPFDAAVVASRLTGVIGFLSMIVGSELVVRQGGGQP